MVMNEVCILLWWYMWSLHCVEPNVVLKVDNSISAAIVVAATVDDFRISANVAQVVGNTE